MKRLQILFLVTITAILVSAVGVQANTVSDEEITALVAQVCDEIAADTPGTLAKIIAAEHPYKNEDNPAFYVFVYDTDVRIVAHPKESLVGKSYKGVPDIRGKNFRDDIVQGALANETGWVDYVYQKPGESGVKPKKTYYKLVTGSDGNQYVVCSGKYRSMKALKNLSN